MQNLNQSINLLIAILKSEISGNDISIWEYFFNRCILILSFFCSFRILYCSMWMWNTARIIIVNIMRNCIFIIWVQQADNSIYFAMTLMNSTSLHSEQKRNNFNTTQHIVNIISYAKKRKCSLNSNVQLLFNSDVPIWNEFTYTHFVLALTESEPRTQKCSGEQKKKCYFIIFVCISTICI